MLIGGIIATTLETELFRENWFRLTWYTVAYLPVAFPVLKEAWESLLAKDVFSEFMLMSIATIGAFAIGEYPEGVAVMLFYTVGELFQEAAVRRARGNINALLDIRPETATVVRAEGTETLTSEEVAIGYTIEVKTGERVPLDGILQTTEASFNTSALTGESVPRTILQGEEVLAGMMVTDRVIRMEVIRPFGQSALSRILQLVENSADKKAPAELFIRRFARIYTPVVVLLATLIVLVPWIWSTIVTGFVYDFSDWLYRGLVFLVISCPCALVISIPLGYFGGIGAASRKGILFKGGNYLDAITQVNTLVMDKTGTLTKGVFRVQSVVVLDPVSADRLVQLVASVEQQSNHPIARAIVGYSREKELNLLSPQEVREISGHGMEAEVEGIHLLAGNTKLLDSRHIVYPTEILSIPETIVVCAIDGVYAGYILVADEPKEDAQSAIHKLKKLGLRRIVMLSGDKQSIADKTGRELGIPEAYGDLLPEGKVDYIEKLRNDPTNKIAFVGDGINDAPVLALSDVGIAMGGLGSDVAIETADIVLQTDQPGSIVTAIQIGRATRRIVIQNIVLALSVKGIVLILGALGIANLWGAVFADVGVALLAVLNAIRIFRMKF